MANFADQIHRFWDLDSDWDTLCNLWREIFPAWPIDPERLLKLIFGFSNLLLIHDHGFCLSYLVGGTHGRIAAFGVLPQYRNQGLGAALLEQTRKALQDAAKEKGTELASLDIGSLVPRFWPQCPPDLPTVVVDFLVHKGFMATGEPGVRDMYKDLRKPIASPDVQDKISKTNVKFSIWSAELADECIRKQKALFSWHELYEKLAAREMFDNVLVALDPETNAQIGWSLICPPLSPFTDAMAFIPLMPSRDKTGLIGAVGVDPSVRGKGIGLAMMVKAMEILRERGSDGVMIDSVSVRGFYEILGCETVWEYEQFVWRGNAAKDE